MGIGGERNIKISTVQSKLTEMKCTNVVLLGLCLKCMLNLIQKSGIIVLVCIMKSICVTTLMLSLKNYLRSLHFLSKHNTCDLSDLIESYFENTTILQSVASAYAALPSWIAYEKARADLEEAKKNDVSPQL